MDPNKMNAGDIVYPSLFATQYFRCRNQNLVMQAMEQMIALFGRNVTCCMVMWLLYSSVLLIKHKYLFGTSHILAAGVRGSKQAV